MDLGEAGVDNLWVDDIVNAQLRHVLKPNEIYSLVYHMGWNSPLVKKIYVRDIEVMLEAWDNNLPHIREVIENRLHQYLAAIDTGLGAGPNRKANWAAIQVYLADKYRVSQEAEDLLAEEINRFKND